MLNILKHHLKLYCVCASKMCNCHMRRHLNMMMVSFFSCCDPVELQIRKQSLRTCFKNKYCSIYLLMPIYFKQSLNFKLKTINNKILLMQKHNNLQKKTIYNSCSPALITCCKKTDTHCQILWQTKCEMLSFNFVPTLCLLCHPSLKDF